MFERIANIRKVFNETYGAFLVGNKYHKKKNGYFKFDSREKFLPLVTVAWLARGYDFKINYDVLPFSQEVNKDRIAEGHLSAEIVYMRLQPDAKTYVNELSEPIEERMNKSFSCFRDYIFPSMQAVHSLRDCYDLGRNYCAKYFGEGGATIRKIWELLSIEEYHQAYQCIGLNMARQNAWLKEQREQFAQAIPGSKQPNARFEDTLNFVQDLMQLKEKIELEDYAYLQTRVEINIQSSLKFYCKYFAKENKL